MFLSVAGVARTRTKPTETAVSGQLCVTLPRVWEENLVGFGKISTASSWDLMKLDQKDIGKSRPEWLAGWSTMPANACQLRIGHSSQLFGIDCKPNCSAKISSEYQLYHPWPSKTCFGYSKLLNLCPLWVLHIGRPLARSCGRARVLNTSGIRRVQGCKRTVDHEEQQIMGRSCSKRWASEMLDAPWQWKPTVCKLVTARWFGDSVAKLLWRDRAQRRAFRHQSFRDKHRSCSTPHKPWSHRQGLPACALKVPGTERQYAKPHWSQWLSICKGAKYVFVCPRLKNGKDPPMKIKCMKETTRWNIKDSPNAMVFQARPWVQWLLYSSLVDSTSNVSGKERRGQWSSWLLWALTWAFACRISTLSDPVCLVSVCVWPARCASVRMLHQNTAVFLPPIKSAGIKSY